jgi:hypothetical protein
MAAAKQIRESDGSVVVVRCRPGMPQLPVGVAADDPPQAADDPVEHVAV